MYQNEGAVAIAQDTLRLLADRRDLLLGAAVDMHPLSTEPRYAEILSREFNTVVAENVFKPHFVWAGPDDYRWDNADRLAQFARENGMALRGHTLVWHQAVPAWLQAGGYTSSEVRRLLEDYIHAIVSRYRGQVCDWDVVNEAIAEGDDPGLRENSFWFKAIGPEYIDLAFRWAHEADPNARLYYNDYEAEDMRPKGNAVFALVKGLQKRGVPIHGVGLQCHLVNGWRVTDEHRQNVRRIADLGLTWQVTECDIRMQLEGGAPTREQLETQAAGYHDVIELCLCEPGCRGFLCWGFTDKHSWIPEFRQGWGAALPLDEEYCAKPAYRAIQRALES